MDMQGGAEQGFRGSSRSTSEHPVAFVSEDDSGDASIGCLDEEGAVLSGYTVVGRGGRRSATEGLIPMPQTLEQQGSHLGSQPREAEGLINLARPSTSPALEVGAIADVGQP